MKTKKPRNYWRSRENVDREVGRIIRENHFEIIPSWNTFYDIGESSVAYAIQNYHGGFNAYRKSMGERVLKQDEGHWTEKTICSEIRRIMRKHNLNNLPSGNELKDMGYGDVCHAISDCGGFRRFRKLLHEAQRKIEDGKWKDFKYAKSQACAFMRENGFTSLPGYKAILELGRSDLVSGISKHQGGMHTFRKNLGQNPKERPKGTWNFEFTLKEAKRVKLEHDWDCLPGQFTLVKRGYSSLAASIDRHGGFVRFRTLLGEEQRIMASGTWKDLEFTIREARKLMREHNLKTMPSNEKLAELGRYDLVNAIYTHHGGMSNFREMLGEEQRRANSKEIRDKDYILKKAREILKKEKWDILPGNSTLYKKGYGSFVNAVNRYHSGIPAIREQLGQKLDRKEAGYNRVWENIEPQLKKIISEFGYFPTQAEMNEAGYSAIVGALAKYHGGMTEARRRLAGFLEQNQTQSKLEGLLGEWVNG